MCVMMGVGIDFHVHPGFVLFFWVSMNLKDSKEEHFAAGSKATPPRPWLTHPARPHALPTHPHPYAVGSLQPTLEVFGCCRLPSAEE